MGVSAHCPGGRLLWAVTYKCARSPSPQAEPAVPDDHLLDPAVKEDIARRARVVAEVGACGPPVPLLTQGGAARSMF